MNNWLAKIAFFTGLMTAPLTTDIDAKNQEYMSLFDIATEEVTNTTKHDVLFTIDDGPSVYMLEIAKTLDSLNYQWIFFVVTRGIKEKTKQDIIDVIQMWHHIWNHSFSHPNFQKLTIDQAKEEILKWDALIASVYKEAGIPREKKYIRYPYGNLPPSSYREEFNAFLDSLGYEKPMYRHMDVLLNECAQAPTDDRIVRMKKWDTILLHERSWTPESIKRVVKNLGDKEKNSAVKD